jgi:hypothetical protein
MQLLKSTNRDAPRTFSPGATGCRNRNFLRSTSGRAIARQAVHQTKNNSMRAKTRTGLTKENFNEACRMAYLALMMLTLCHG